MVEDRAPNRVACLADFVEDSRDLSPEQFRERHGDLYFLHNGPVGKLNPTSEGQITLAREGRGTSPGLPLNPAADFVVFHVPPARKGKAGDDLIWIGRSEENNLVIPDASVSAIHAFLRLDPGGCVRIHDSGSRNGSQVDDVAVPAPGMGPPAALEPGSRVVLGDVKLTFLHATEFQNLVKRLLEP